MLKTVTVDLDKRTANVIIHDLPLYAIQNLPAMLKDIADELARLCKLQSEGVYIPKVTTSDKNQETPDTSEASGAEVHNHSEKHP